MAGQESQQFELSKISALPLASSIDKLMALGVDKNGDTVQVTMELLKGNVDTSSRDNIRQIAFDGTINLPFSRKGYYVNNAGVLTPLGNYSATDPEKVKEGDVLIYSGDNGDSGSGVFGYSDINLNNPVMLLGAGQKFNNRKFVIPYGSGINYVIAGGRNDTFLPAPTPLRLTLVVIKEPLRPAAEQKVWHPLTTFPTLSWMKDFVVSLELYSDSFDKTKSIVVQSVRVNNGVGRTFITIGYVDDINGNVPIASANQIALHDNLNWIEPILQNGHRYETITFVERNGYKVIGSMKVDWAVVPRSTAAYDYFSAYPVKDALLSINAWSSISGELSGSIDITHQIDGIDARLVTSNTYNVNNAPDHLMIYCHGNGQTLETGLPSATALAWFKAHGISYAIIKIQDQAYAPFNTRASGWGNEISYNRILKLYNYLMANFNFHKTVILAGGSMGGLTMGRLAYMKPFPISFCLGIGIVPGVKIIWNNSVNRREPIRNSFGMAANGSDDANLSTFTQGYDWFDMGMLTIGSDKIKVGFPNFYLFHGTDATFTNEFGGLPQYEILRDSLLKSGVYSVIGTDGSTSHSSPTLFDYAIAQGVFERELGIKS